MTGKKRGHRTIRGLERLEARTMLSGNGVSPLSLFQPKFGADAGSHDIGAHAISFFDDSRSDATGSWLASNDLPLRIEHAPLTAILSDANDHPIGTATYIMYKSGGVAETDFSVSVQGAAANRKFDVSIDGAVVGQLTTDEPGAGKLVLSSNPMDSERALPANFPEKIGADTSIRVGALSGTLTLD